MLVSSAQEITEFFKNSLSRTVRCYNPIASLEHSYVNNRFYILLTASDEILTTYMLR